METPNFTYAFTMKSTPQQAFEWLKKPKNWWIGLYNETIEGKSENVGDEFSFRAGEGVHESHQKLIELKPGATIAGS